MYSVGGRRARLDEITSQYAWISMGRSFDQQIKLWFCGDALDEIQETWQDFKQARQEYRIESRTNANLNQAFVDKLEPLGLKVYVYQGEMLILGDYEKFQRLLSQINSQDQPSVLSELLR